MSAGGELCPQGPAGRALEVVGEPGRGGVGTAAGEQVDVVGHDLQRLDTPALFGALGGDQLTEPVGDPAIEDGAAVLRAPDEVILQRIDAACVPFVACRTHVLSIAHNSIPVNY